jgi:hypothetical protein
MNIPTREALYEKLKSIAPDLAIGKTRARREELERLLLIEQPGVYGVRDITMLPAPVVTPLRPRRAKPRQTKVKAVIPLITDAQRENLSRTLATIDASKHVLDTAPLTTDNLAHLVSLFSEVPVSTETVKSVLNTFFGLRSRLSQKSAA